MRHSIDADKKADYYADKAASVGKGGISADDPDAIAKLKLSLGSRVAIRETMKRVNKVWRQYDKNPMALTTQQALATLSQAEHKIVTTFDKSTVVLDKSPFPRCELTNNNAEIRRLKQRIDHLQASRQREIAEPIKGKGCSIVEKCKRDRPCS